MFYCDKSVYKKLILAKKLFFMKMDLNALLQNRAVL